MKTLKSILSLILALSMTLGLCACGGQTGVTKEEVAQMIEDANEVARAAGYADGLHEGLSRADGFICDCPNHTNSDTTPTLTTLAAEEEPEVAKAEHLPILMTYSGTWLDQNGDPMSYADAERFFKTNREYAKVAVAINNLCEELQSDFYRHNLDTVRGWATASPYDTDEYLTYEWILSEMEANYDSYLNDLLVLVGDQIDFDSSSAANVATCIILEKMLEFRDDGTYEASINPHRKHDCEVEGCNQTTTTTIQSSPFVPKNEKSEVDWNAMTTAEIIAYFDEQRTTSETDFDLLHPNLYFDRFGYAHGSDVPNDGSYYYATRDGKVYKLDNPTDLSRIGESPNSDVRLLGNYVGETTRRIK